MDPFLCVVITCLFPLTRLLFVLSQLVPTKGLTATQPLGWLWERSSNGDNAFSLGTGPSSSWSKHCCYKLFLGHL